MNKIFRFKHLSILLLVSLLCCSQGCNLLKKNLDNADLGAFRANNQAQLDSLMLSAGRSAAQGMADSAHLIAQNMLIGLKGAMDTLDPDFKKLENQIKKFGSLTQVQIDSLGDLLEKRLDSLKGNLKDEDLALFFTDLLEESVGKLKSSTKTALSDMIAEALKNVDTETLNEKIQVILRGALGDSTKIMAQQLVSGALQPTVDSVLNRIEKIVQKDVPFVKKQAENLLLALAALSITIIGWVWYQRRRYAKLVGILTYQIDKIPSQELYDELTKRIRNETQKTELEPLLREILKQQGINT
jgi:hypothetical protein